MTAPFDHFDTYEEAFAADGVARMSLSPTCAALDRLALHPGVQAVTVGPRRDVMAASWAVMLIRSVDRAYATEAAALLERIFDADVAGLLTMALDETADARDFVKMALAHLADVPPRACGFFVYR